MLTGTVRAVQQLLGQIPIASPAPSTFLAVFFALFLGWWGAHFAVRYGKGLWHCYSVGAQFNESQLLLWSATAGRVAGTSNQAPKGKAAFMGLQLPPVPQSLSVFSAVLLGGVAFALVSRWGLAWAFWVALAAFAVLLVLAIIDAQTTLLPDTLTLGLLWLGLLASWVPGLALVSVSQAVLGAAAGYGVLWLLFWFYWLVRRQEGMGRGDFKLMAAVGAWLGWQSLPQVLLLACLASVAYVLLFIRRGARSEARAFGPFLAGAALLAVCIHPAAHFVSN